MILLVGGFNPSEKYARQNGNLPQIGVKINISETTTQTRSFVLNTSIQRQYNTTADGIRKQSNRNQKRYQYYSLTVTYYKQTNKQTNKQSIKSKQNKSKRIETNQITSHHIKSNKSIPIHQIFQSAAFEHIPSHFFFSSSVNKTKSRMSSPSPNKNLSHVTCLEFLRGGSTTNVINGVIRSN